MVFTAVNNGVDRANPKSYRKMRDDTLNGTPIAKEGYEKPWLRDVQCIILRKTNKLPRNRGILI